MNLICYFKINVRKKWQNWNFLAPIRYFATKLSHIFHNIITIDFLLGFQICAFIFHGKLLVFSIYTYQKYFISTKYRHPPCTRIAPTLPFVCTYISNVQPQKAPYVSVRPSDKSPGSKQRHLNDIYCSAEKEEDASWSFQQQQPSVKSN